MTPLAKGTSARERGGRREGTLSATFVRKRDPISYPNLRRMTRRSSRSISERKKGVPGKREGEGGERSSSYIFMRKR